MIRKDYSEIPESAYLFGRTSNNRPEEKVRQWALFELMTSYGFLVNCLKIEYQAQIGSKKFPADIVVLRNDMPYIVIECKRLEVAFEAKHLAQGISYADNIQAEYAVWTNGTAWVVKRKVSGNWYDVSDIPSRKTVTDVNFGSYARNLGFLARILFWHNRAVPFEHSAKFLEEIPTLLATVGIDKLSDVPKSLLEGLIHLSILGAMINAPKLSRDTLKQRMLIERLVAVLSEFGQFFELIHYDGQTTQGGKSYNIWGSEEAFSGYLRTYEKTGSLPQFDMGVRDTVIVAASELVRSIRYLAQNDAGIYNHQAIFLAACEAVAKYLEAAFHETRGGLSESQVDQILAVFQETFLTPFRFRLPSKLEPEESEKLRRFCEPYWNEIKTMPLIHS